MAAVYDLKAEEGLRAYLVAKGKTPVSIRPLSGGTANYVYRVEFTEGSTAILKHAAPFLASNQTFAFDPARMGFEATILKALSSIKGLSTSDTHAVQLLEYDSNEKLLCIEDGGERTLKEAYKDRTLSMTDIGRRLATWIAKLHCTNEHSLSLGEPTQSTTNSPMNNAIAVQIYRYSYNNLHIALTKYGYNTEIAYRVNEDFGSLLASDDECICHGDFWPGNVLVQGKRQEASSNPSENFSNLTIVDWEMSRRGTSATDVGQFAAEAFLLDTFHGDRGLRRHFLNAYALAREGYTDDKPLDKEWIRRMAVHWAVHIGFWPTQVPWTDEQGTRELVDLAICALQAAVDSDWEGLMKSPLFLDLGDYWNTMLMAVDKSTVTEK
jgi:thiamine kinase-like enzyme